MFFFIILAPESQQYDHELNSKITNSTVRPETQQYDHELNSTNRNSTVRPETQQYDQKHNSTTRKFIVQPETQQYDQKCNSTTRAQDYKEKDKLDSKQISDSAFGTHLSWFSFWCVPKNSMPPSNGEQGQSTASMADFFNNNERFHNKYSNASNEAFMKCGIDFVYCEVPNSCAVRNNSVGWQIHPN